MQLLGLSGSLRGESSNTSLLRAAAALAPDGVTVIVFDGIGDLPHMRPDLDATAIPSVVRLRAAVAEADGVIISCPEYAHGVPGSFKNALDWLVGGPEFPDKPVAFFNVSDRGSYALASLIETVTVMTGRVVRDGSVTLPLVSGTIDERRILDDPALADMVRDALRRLAAGIGDGTHITLSRTPPEPTPGPSRSPAPSDRAGSP
jgi:NAD(P)H-dependent FMN reductase